MVPSLATFKFYGTRSSPRRLLWAEPLFALVLLQEAHQRVRVSLRWPLSSLKSLAVHKFNLLLMYTGDTGALGEVCTGKTYAKR